MSPHQSLPRRQRGVALITAVLMVALATILAVNVGFRGYLEQRRSMTVFALDQGYEVALGAEAWAADILRADKRDSKTDFTGEIWATPIPPLPIDGGELEGRLEDQQGRFNLNNLLRPDGKANPQALAQFERILVALNLETRWAGMIADWIDADSNPAFPDGAEDGVYLGESPPYRAANMPVTRVSELLSLPDFGLERYQKLQPYVTALPAGTPLNLCTAPGIVIDALSDGVQSFGTDLKHLADMRTDKCFPNLNDLRAAVGQAAFDGMKDALSEQSSYFSATVWVTIGTTQFTLYSLLHRTDAGLVRPILRSFGTD